MIRPVCVLDPACGSGNVLYVALALMKGLEKELIAFAALHGVAIEPRVHPKQLFGIEINPYAHELASIVIWIGYLQGKWRNAVPFDDRPILPTTRSGGAERRHFWTLPIRRTRASQNGPALM